MVSVILSRLAGEDYYRKNSTPIYPSKLQ